MAPGRVRPAMGKGRAPPADKGRGGGWSAMAMGWGGAAWGGAGTCEGRHGRTRELEEEDGEGESSVGEKNYFPLIIGMVGNFCPTPQI